MPRLASLGLLLALFFCFPDAKAELNKCTDGRQITYTTDPCEKTGLTSAGPIKNAVTIMPLFPKPRDGSADEPGKEHMENNSAQKVALDGTEASDTGASGESAVKPASTQIK